MTVEDMVVGLQLFEERMKQENRKGARSKTLACLVQVKKRGWEAFEKCFDEAIQYVKQKKVGNIKDGKMYARLKHVRALAESMIPDCLSYEKTFVKLEEAGRQFVQKLKISITPTPHRSAEGRAI